MRLPAPCDTVERTGSTGAGGRFARLPGGILLLELPCAAPGGGAALRLDGVPVRLVWARPLSPARSFCLLAGASAAGQGDRAELLRDGHPPAAMLLLPELPPRSLLLQRPPAEQRLLLRRLVDTHGLLPGLGASTDFAAACLALAARLPMGQARAMALSRPDSPVSAWRVPPGAPSGSWFLLTEAAIHRLASPGAGFLVVDRPVLDGARLLPPGAEAALPMVARPGLPTLHALCQAAEPPRRGMLLGALAAAAGRSPGCAALLREAQLFRPAEMRRLHDPAAPVGGALELALADGEGGVFLGGWLRDPLDMVEGLGLRGPWGAAHPVPGAALHRLPRPDLTEHFARAPLGGAGLRPGFVAHLDLPGAAQVAQWRLDLRLRSGEALELVAPSGIMPPAAARTLVLRAFDAAALRPELMASCIAPAVERLHRAARAWPGEPEVVRFGPSPPRPRCSLVIPLYRNLSFLRFQVAAFARDPELRRCEILFVLDSPEQRAEVEHLLHGLQLLHDLPLVLAVQPHNRGFSESCNVGARAAAASLLMFLNSDVVPAAPGWLGPLLRRLARDRRLAAVGPKLLFADGSLQHAGLLFRHGPDGIWLNDHYWKGLPRDFPAACRARRVPGLTGAALCLRRAAFEAVGGFCTDYVVGGFEDSDLCLRLREAGGEIQYEPASELYHYEQQSIRGHAGHARTLANAYNRRLHHRRWDAAITALMRRFPEH